MKQVNLRNQPTVFASRRQSIVTCPHCWTEQHAERDFCYRCAAEFQYRDEQAKKPKAG